MMSNGWTAAPEAGLGEVLDMAIHERKRKMVVVSIVALTMPLIVLFTLILRLMTRFVDEDIGGRNRPFILSFLLTINPFIIVVAVIGFLWGISMLIRRRYCLERECAVFVICMKVVLLGYTGLFFAAWSQHSLGLIA